MWNHLPKVPDSNEPKFLLCSPSPGCESCFLFLAQFLKLLITSLQDWKESLFHLYNKALSEQAEKIHFFNQVREIRL
jgi:hypothetical protein